MWNNMSRTGWELELTFFSLSLISSSLFFISVKLHSSILTCTKYATWPDNTVSKKGEELSPRPAIICRRFDDVIVSLKFAENQSLAVLNGRQPPELASWSPNISSGNNYPPNWSRYYRFCKCWQDPDNLISSKFPIANEMKLSEYFQS